MDLSELQYDVCQIEKLRGYSEETVGDKFILLMEENGELAKAVWEGKGVEDIAAEIADVIFLITCIAKRYEIDLNTAIREKFNDFYK
jgi:NTP pyrophosphatase (non-canonical NTP hydrolase)